MQIQAAVSRVPRAPLSFETLELEALRENEILVQVVASGVCHTDIAARDQMPPVPQPIVLGHEGAGIVQAVGGAVRKVRPGDHVVMSYDYCGHCPSCQVHAPTYCHHLAEANFGGLRDDGTSALSSGGQSIYGNFFGQSSFATHSICTERNIVKVPEDLPLEMLGPLGCGIQTGAGVVINVLRPHMGQSLAIFGVGAVGLAALMAARAIGVTTIIAVDRVESRLQMAQELGATHLVNPGQGVDSVEEIRRITGSGVDFSFDNTGRISVLRQAVDALAPRGMCGFVAGYPAGTELSVDAGSFMITGKTLRGIVQGDSNPTVFIPELIALYRQGRFPYDRLIRFYPFHELNQALADSESGKTIKPVVRMQP